MLQREEFVWTFLQTLQVLNDGGQLAAEGRGSVSRTRFGQGLLLRRVVVKDAAGQEATIRRVRLVVLLAALAGRFIALLRDDA